MAELHRGGFTTVFTTDTALECRAYLSSFLNSHTNQLSHPVLINHGKRILFKDSLVDIHRQEFSHVVAAVAEGHLREVIGSKREEIGLLRDLVRRERCTRDFDHCTDLVFHRIFLFVEYFLDSLFDDILLGFKLVDNPRERHHNLGNRLNTFFLQFQGSFHDGTRLHLGNLGIEVAKTASTKAKHRVGLHTSFYPFVNILVRNTHHLRHLHLPLLIVRNKFMQGGIKKSYRYGHAHHRFKNPYRIILVQREQLLQRHPSSL